jgi:excisionase family DNA binding protein
MLQSEGMNGRMPRERDFLPVGKAAELLGVSGSSLRAWANTGELPVYRTPGGQRRFRRADLVAFAETTAVGELTVAQAAEVLGVSAGAVRTWANDGLIPAQRTPGGERRFRRADLVAFAETTAVGELTVAQAAEVLGVSAGTLRNWANDGLITAHRTPGGERRFRRSDVAAFLDSMRARGRAGVATADTTRRRR